MPPTRNARSRSPATSTPPASTNSCPNHSPPPPSTGSSHTTRTPSSPTGIDTATDSPSNPRERRNVPRQLTRTARPSPLRHALVFATTVAHPASREKQWPPVGRQQGRRWENRCPPTRRNRWPLTPSAAARTLDSATAGPETSVHVARPVASGRVQPQPAPTLLACVLGASGDASALAPASGCEALDISASLLWTTVA